MILNVEFIHEAQVLRRRRRTPETAYYTASVTVDIASATDDEAPVVATHPRQPDRTYDRLETVAFREFGGQLFRQQTRHAYARTKAEHASFAELQAAAADVMSNERAFNLPQEMKYKYPDFSDGALPKRPLRQSEDSDVSKVISTGEEQCVEMILKWAADRICVNGLLWIPAVEPLLVYDVRESKFTIDEMPHTDMLLGSIDHYFRLGEQDSALAFLREVDLIEAQPIPGIDVRHPDAFKFKVDEWRLIRPARCIVPRVVSQFGAGSEILTSPDSGCAELKKAVSELESPLRSGGECDASALAAAVEKVLAGPLSRLNWPENGVIYPLLVECRQALSRWKANGDIVADDDLLDLAP